MRTRALLAVLAAALLALLPRAAWAAPSGDAGAPAAVSADGGARTRSAGAAPQRLRPIRATAAHPPRRRPRPTEPSIRLPPTVAEQAEGLPIASVEIAGNRRVSREDIHSYLREKPGHLFTVANLTADVHSLWDSGLFEDIQADHTTNDRGAVLRFVVRERPNIKDITFGGNDEIEDDKLHEAVELKPNSILSVPAVPQRPEDQGRLRREGLLPRRRRVRDRPAARQRSDREVHDHRALAGHRPTRHVYRQRARPRVGAARSDGDRVDEHPLVRVRRVVPPGHLRARRPCSSPPSITTRAT